jgi:hypothetical protein
VNKFLIFLLLIVSSALIGRAQELNCRVVIESRQIQTTERTIFQEMETSFTQFMNDRQWTDDEFEREEKINCNIIITLESQPSIGNYTATVQVLSARPIFGASYETVLFNFADRDWAFEYTQSQPLNYNDNTYISNLTSLMAFYAYMIIAYDYDSFESLGGDEYFNKAQQVVNNAQQAGNKGWNQFNSNRNRFWLVENTLNPQMKPFRNAFYEYHRLGLDLFAVDADASRTTIEKAVKDIHAVNRIKPRSIYTISFLDAKYNEFVNIFTEGNLATRRNVYNLLKDIDPSRGSDYEKMIK